MNVIKVTATVRYSQDTGKGSWKSLELGCEATVSETEDAFKAQATLYGQLARQFRELWQKNGTAPAQDALGSPNGSQANPQTATLTKEHWCELHQREWKSKKGKYGTFYSHKAPDGSWCNEAKK
jgi:hypothetical protein